MAKKIVVTGLGAFSPLGGTAPETWDALLAGRSGISPLDNDWHDRYELPVYFAGTIAQPVSERMPKTRSKRLDPSSQFAVLAAHEAFEDAAIAPGSTDPERLLVEWATGIGGVWTLLDAWDTLRERGPRRVLPLTVPMLMPNSPAASISMELGAAAGARTAVSACASSTESIINAYDHLQLGLADVAIAGGSEAAIHPLPLAAFAALHALSTRNDDPERASRPYDVDRDGFVLGEGGAALVLETEEHALARGARIYAEVVSGGVTADAYHVTAPEPHGLGASRAIEFALDHGGLRPDDVVHINAHATSTPVGDIAEYHAFERVFGERTDRIPVSATKASTGHLLGGAGAIEAVFTVLALAKGILPPTINLDRQDPEIGLDVVVEPREFHPGTGAAISTSFGFGGHNAVAVFRAYR